MQRNCLDPVLPSDQDVALAARARHIIAAGEDVGLRDLPPLVRHLLMDILKETEVGNAVTLVSIETEITTQQAADLLNVSRPFLIGMVEAGTLPARLVGKHRRLPLRDVLAYKVDQVAKRHQALDEIVAFDQEFGLL